MMYMIVTTAYGKNQLKLTNIIWKECSVFKVEPCGTYETHSTFLSVPQQFNSGLCRLILEVSRPHAIIHPQPVGLL
jgi:hypothetical protein